MFRDLVKDIQFQNVIFFNFVRLKSFGMIGVFSCEGISQNLDSRAVSGNFIIR